LKVIAISSPRVVSRRRRTLVSIVTLTWLSQQQGAPGALGRMGARRAFARALSEVSTSATSSRATASSAWHAALAAPRGHAADFSSSSLETQVRRRIGSPASVSRHAPPSWAASAVRAEDTRRDRASRPHTAGARAFPRSGSIAGPAGFAPGRRPSGLFLPACAASAQARHASTESARGGWFGFGKGAGVADASADTTSAVSGVADASSAASGVADAVADAVAANVASLDASALASAARVGGEVAAIAGDSWYTTSALMYAIEYFHVAQDMEWWAAIVATTVAMRVVALPLTVMQQKNAARMHLAKPEIEAINKLAQTHSQDKEALERYQAEIWKIWAKYDCNPVKMFAPLFVQAPVFISFFIAIQRMSAGVPSFATGGASWFTDLSVADATYALPLLSSLTFLLSVETNPPNGTEPQVGMKWGMRALAAVMIPLTASFPQGVFVYWVTTNVFSLFQATALRAPALKKLGGHPGRPGGARRGGGADRGERTEDRGEVRGRAGHARVEPEGTRRERRTL
jgi:YidC/Oxa1 family membrane protein insertase